MRLLVAAAISLSVFGVAQAEQVPAKVIWAGEMRQIEANAETTYPMTLTLYRNSVTADYPTLKCTGAWTKVAEANGYLMYTETVTNEEGANCIDGIVWLKVDEGKVVLGWFGADAEGPIVAIATLFNIPTK